MAVKNAKAKSRQEVGGAKESDLRILCDATSAGSALRELYERRKAVRDSFSLAYMCRKTGASKGYISDVLRGRRKLNPSYWAAFVDLFQLQGASRGLFEILLKLERCKDVDERQQLEGEWQRLRKLARAHIKSFPHRARGMFFALELFCAFGLFDNQPTLAQLKAYYGRARAVEVDEALRFLVGMDLIAFDGERYRLLQDHIGFLNHDEDDPLSYQNYLRQGLDRAKTNVSRWCMQRDEAIFESTFLSVKNTEFQAAIAKIRQTMHEMQADLESSKADQLLLFNVQIFPVGNRPEEG